MTLKVRAPRLIDGTGAEPLRDAVVQIAGPTIEALDADPAGALALDGCTLLPGLIDAHTHLGVLPMEEQFDDKMPAAVAAAHIFDNAARVLDAGFTTARDMGGVDGGLATAIERGLVRGPRLLPSGPIICQTGGHGDYGYPFHPHRHEGVPGLFQLSLVADGPDEMTKAARTVLRRGATQVKVCVSGGVVSLSDELEHTQFTVPELRAAVIEAGARGTYVTAHAHTVGGIRNGLEAGVACFEHATFLDDDTVAAIARAGAAIVPTMTVIAQVGEDPERLGLPSFVAGRVEGVLESMGRSLKMAHAAGIRVGSGSDTLGIGQHGFGRELSIKARFLSPMDAIVSATSVNASILRRDDLGVLAPGKTADLIGVRGDPLRDPELFDDPANVVLIVQNGRIVKDAR